MDHTGAPEAKAQEATVSSDKNNNNILLH